ncbi:hypothetical protein [Clostridium thermobutyricum]|uniref:Phage head-tail joining protein n=1 Tax=Clostridium thermobutyricum DSM 4928 TaxID=1121339 RepID=A0A1V4SXW4_9CLOT|nr:hypothetical protein [Clostridium thermobutyricum]OPX48495.1 hypothetical protein CLTHE_11740 [Clostridium thermobutyricum DSM 4928]
MLVSDRLLKNQYWTTKIKSSKNEINQVINSYVKDVWYKCNMQPITEQSIKYIWGNEVKSNIQIFCNENINVGDLIVINNISYEIEKKYAWGISNYYAILESDINVQS